ncbi:cation-translocating P-type ATPase [Rhodohalobacter sulfatireducens]|uniref:Cation-transporting P-type ATPase n=1 Tax=Rhodohalobacter sulfatireducens TaxID=2911366 RepID=A0ABS9K8Y8_9BACT|nr:cation-transporting P-type ATPase [Rhodohalobacter sulfatireducens]MCG2587319.1 cation-transporting P-type ATPase [Rhodohalobacter sulfatireducens]
MEGILGNNPVLLENQKMGNETTGSVNHQPWSISFEEALQNLDSNQQGGLTSQEVTKRLSKFGKNKLREYKKKSIFEIIADQFKSLIILLLVVAAVSSFLFGEYLDGWAILVVVLISAMIGFITELRAVRSMEALYKLGHVQTRVLRNGKVSLADAETLVPGDIVLLEGGDVVTADLRILESSRLQADESVLTGESLPVSKEIEPLSSETVLAERNNMLYKGTAITRGSGKAVVVSTGMETELGAISELVQGADDEKTPLEERLNKLGNKLIWVTLGIASVITITGIYTGREIIFMIQTGVALAVATIPEGLPVVATIALANGVKTMAGKNALITRLSSVETLGSTQVIFTDKTGTLTENRMTAQSYLLPSGEVSVSGNQDQDKKGLSDNPILKDVLETGILCNNATLTDLENVKGSGDPLEIALLAAAENFGISVESVRNEYPEEREEAFDAEAKMMATWNSIGEGTYRVHVKGAPDAVLRSCNSVYANGSTKPMAETEREEWIEKNNQLAAQGLRMIAFAQKDVSSTDGNPYETLAFTGLVGLLDPPRSDVKQAIENCKRAGINVVMVTGDQEHTARYIANEIGIESDPNANVVHGRDLAKMDIKKLSNEGKRSLLETTVFARISPAQKLSLIDLFQANNRTVAMTGDGVNDAPALKSADIGIAMGRRGSQVAREAADMILTDDAFSSIVTAIEQGRIIFTNIRKFVYYLMSCNVSEVTVIALSFVVGSPLPILPLQILFLNLVTDVFPALALGLGEGEKQIMREPPRKRQEPILTNQLWFGIAGYGALISMAVMATLFVGMKVMNLPVAEAVTLSFLTLAFAQLWHVFNMRGDRSSIVDNTIINNRFVWGAIVLSAGLILAAVYIPSLANVLSIHPPAFNGWAVVLIFSLVPIVAGELIRLVFNNHHQAGITPTLKQSEA